MRTHRLGIASAIAMSAVLLGSLGIATFGSEDVEPQRVLFIGNSFTYTWEVPQQFEGSRLRLSRPRRSR